MVDNLKSAVLQRLTGAAPVFNPQYLDFSRHYGFEIVPCLAAMLVDKFRYHLPLHRQHQRLQDVQVIETRRYRE